jgi:hypothetical protein
MGWAAMLEEEAGEGRSVRGISSRWDEAGKGSQIALIFGLTDFLKDRRWD